MQPITAISMISWN